MSGYVPPACVYGKAPGLLVRQRIILGPPARDKEDRMDVYTSPELYIGHSPSDLPLPCLVIDLITVRKNCNSMFEAIKDKSCPFRVDTGVMKTGPLTKIMLGGLSKSVAISSISEIHGIMPLVDEGVIDDVLFCGPFPYWGQEAEVMYLAGKVKTTFVLTHQHEIGKLAELNSMRYSCRRKWPVFLRVNTGSQGVNGTKDLVSFLRTKPKLELKGFLSDNSSLSPVKTTPQEQITSLSALVEDLGLKAVPLTLSIEANTPNEIINVDTSILADTHKVEWKIGSHAINDLQRVSASHAKRNDIAMDIHTRVISVDPSRNERLLGVGSSVLSRETSSMFPGFGTPKITDRWYVGRMSDSLGCLVTSPGNDKDNAEGVVEDYWAGHPIELDVQNASATAGAFDYYFVTDFPRFLVTEVWTRWKPWL